MTLSRISFISAVNTTGTHWLKGEKLETLLFFMAGDKESLLRSYKKLFLKKIQNANSILTIKFTVVQTFD